MTRRIGASEYREMFAKAKPAPVRPKRKSKPVEQDLTRAILQALTTQLGVFCWRNNSGTMPAEHKGKARYIHMSPTGSPDIFGILRGGKLFGIEVKSKTGKQSAKQEAWGNRMIKLGAHYDVVRSIGEATGSVREWMRGQP
jgi:hypothetical protein